MPNTPAQSAHDDDLPTELMQFISSSPTPWHAVRNAASYLEAHGFTEQQPTSTFDDSPRGFVVRGGSLVAWRGRPGSDGGGFRMIGAHSDSPGLRVRPRPDTGAAGLSQVAVEPYGGTLLNSWLDRDLTVAGRVQLRDRRTDSTVSTELFHHAAPVLRVAQLAIHLDRDVNEALKLDRQRHIQPIWGIGDPTPGAFREFLASEVGVDASEVLSWDAQLVDVQPPTLLGRDRELLAAPRLDNLCSCFGAVRAIASDAESTPAVVVLNDHEEVGSTSATGAVGAWLAQVLERVVAASGGDRSDLLNALAGSVMLSADMAHATHPNYVERHEPSHHVALGAGPVIKHNVNMRYATEATSAGAFKLACTSAGVPFQEYSHRGDLPCGSTIGPLTAAALAVDTLDVGMAQLSMHSARELMAAADVALMCAAFTAWLDGS